MNNGVVVESLCALHYRRQCHKSVVVVSRRSASILVYKTLWRTTRLSKEMLMKLIEYFTFDQEYY